MVPYYLSHRRPDASSVESTTFAIYNFESIYQSCAHDILPRVRKTFAANAGVPNQITPRQATAELPGTMVQLLM